MSLQAIAKFLINPYLYFFIGLLFLIISKKNRKAIIIILAIFFYIVSIPFSGAIFTWIWNVKDTYDSKKMYDAVIVATGLTDSEWYLREKKLKTLTFKPRYYIRFSPSADRVLAGIGFVKSGQARMLLLGEWIPKVYLNNGYVYYNEANIVKEFALAQGLEDNQIEIYSEVKNSLDEARGVKNYYTNNLNGRLLLVTSELHMRRALALYKKQGLTLDVFSVNRKLFDKWNKNSWKLFVPSPKGCENTKKCLYELAGYIGYYVTGDL